MSSRVRLPRPHNLKKGSDPFFKLWGIMEAMKRLAVAVCLLILASCGGAPTEPRDFEFGRVDVYVRDTTGQPVNGVAVRLNRTNGQTEDPGGMTGSVGLPGYFFFLKTSGQFDVVINIPDGFSLAPQQSTVTRVEFSRNQLQTITFVLRHD